LIQYERTKVTINLDNIYDNVCEMKKCITGNAKSMFIIKADGYGHGAIQIMKYLKDSVDAYKSAPYWGDNYAYEKLIQAIPEEKFTYTYKDDNLTATVTGLIDSQATEIYVLPTTLHNGKVYRVTAIKDNAFSNNTNVVNVIISSGVNTIGSNAFMGCSNLVRVYIPHYVQEVGEYIFGNCAQNLTIYTDEDSSYSKYEQWDSTWNKYDSTTTYTVVYEYSLDSFMELI